MPLDTNDALDLIGRRHAEWHKHVNTWNRLLDSLEGGETYREAKYGTETHTSSSGRHYEIYNLKRHKRERFNPRSAGSSTETVIGGIRSDTAAALATLSNPGGTDPYATAGEDDFELRRARTPVPDIFADIVNGHRDKIYGVNREVTRKGSDDLLAFFENVNGLGTSIDQWMQDEAAPVALSLGFLDLQFDRPPLPAGATVQSRADEERFALNSGRVSIILPENLPWWRLSANPDGPWRYDECLVIEHRDDPKTGAAIRYFRHWTTTESTLYDKDGETIERTPHSYGRVPIARVFDTKKLGSRNSGKSAYEGISERMREVYNLMSELMLGDTLQAFPQIQAPEDWCKTDQTVPIGPGFVLPMKKIKDGAGYQPWLYLDPPKGAADSTRINIALHTIEAYRMAAMPPPPGVESMTGRFDDQSGLAKDIDSHPVNALLAKRAAFLARIEMAIADGFALVTGRDKGEVEINYPSVFGGHVVEKQTGQAISLQQFLEGSGQCPKSEAAIAKQLYRGINPGLQDHEYEPFEQEIDAYLERKGELRAAMLDVQDKAIEAGATPASNNVASNIPENTGQPERHSAAGVSAMLTPK